MKAIPGWRGRTAKTLASVVLVTCLLLGMAPAVTAPTAAAGSGSQPAEESPSPVATVGGATFDFYSQYPEQYLSPMDGKTKTFMPLETRNVGEQSGAVKITVEPESSWFEATVDPSEVEPTIDRTGKSRVHVECEKDTPDNTIGWLRVTGTRGTEKHYIWLKVDVVASKPRRI